VAHSGAFDMNVALPQATPPAAPSPTTAEEPTPPRLDVLLTGASRRWRVSVAHARMRDAASRIDVAIALEHLEGDHWRPAPLRSVDASFAYYVGRARQAHRSALSAPVERYPFSLSLPHDGKYHLDLELDSTAGSPSFVCDLCVGSDASRCPRLRPLCTPKPERPPATQPKAPEPAPPPAVPPPAPQPPPPAEVPPKAPEPPPPAASSAPRKPQRAPAWRKRYRYRFPQRRPSYERPPEERPR
jgi:hypothetical protein